jgi:DNA-directed RNA polymerase subunit M/transcription elongation factor TFIIS
MVKCRSRLGSVFRRPLLEFDRGAATLYGSAKMQSMNNARAFVAIRGTDFQCPRCWIDQEKRSNLQPTGKGTSNTDFFRCGSCEYEFALHF